MSHANKRGTRLSVLLAGLLLNGGSLLGAAAARGADRPSEADMFGSSPAPGPTGKPAGTAGHAAGAEESSRRGEGGDAGAGGVAPASAPPAKAAPVETPDAPATAASPQAPTASPSSPPAAAAASSSGAAGGRDSDLLGDPSAGPRLSQDVAPDDPLKIGGQIYLRANYSNPGSQLFDSSTGASTGAVTFSAPSLVDGYFDARPNDRVRGFMLGRMFFDPTLSSTASGGTGSSTTMNPMMPMVSGTSGSATSPTTPLVSGTSTTRGPSMVLDQLWLRFDLFRTIFVTAGRQHVKWGTARLWSPTDFLHPVHRNPTAVFDARPGFTMLKLHLPWEERGWNFYGFALVEGVRRWDRGQAMFVNASDNVPTLGQIGAAGRAEFVLGPAELGLDIVAYKDQKPRYGGDLSFGIGDFDLYVDAGFTYGSEIPRVDVSCSTGAPLLDCIYYSVGIKPQVTAGGTYSMKYNDNDVFTVGGEYFYNSRGYDDPHVYPGLFRTGTFEFFYTGRHYAALSAILAAPWSWNYTTFNFSTLGNLSDQSFTSRIDYAHTLLTHLSFEAFAAVNYGRREGEFRLGVNDLMLGGQTITLKPQAFSLGVGLRIKI